MKRHPGRRHRQKVAFRALALFAAWLWAPAAHAAVVFSPDPLFSVENALAGDGASGRVIVSNPTNEPQGVWLSVVNGTSTRSLAHVLLWSVQEDGGARAYGPEPLAVWFDETPRFLGTVAPGATKSFTLSLRLPSEASSAVARGMVAFGVCVGVGQGEAQCSQDESGSFPQGEGEGGSAEDGGEPEATASGAGGGGGPPPALAPLVIFDVEGTAREEAGVIVVSWKTNRPATSQVIFGNAHQGPYSLNLSKPNYGYPFATPEDFTLRTEHRVELRDLPHGAYEVRAVSREPGGLPTITPALIVDFSTTSGEVPPGAPLPLEESAAGGTQGEGGTAGGGSTPPLAAGGAGEGGAERPREGAQGEESEGRNPSRAGLAAALGVLGENPCVFSWGALGLVTLLLLGRGAGGRGVRFALVFARAPVRRGSIAILVALAVGSALLSLPTAAVVFGWGALVSLIVEVVPAQARRWQLLALGGSALGWFGVFLLEMFAPGVLHFEWCASWEPLVPSLVSAALLAFVGLRGQASAR